MEPFASGELTIQPSRDPGGVRLDWRGKSSARDPRSILAPYFETAFDAAAADAGARLEMHFEDLEHFNSSTISALIAAIQVARARGVRLALVYRAALKWQRLSFEALRVFVRDDALELRAL
jgi:hypothetical protein